MEVKKNKQNYKYFYLNWTIKRKRVFKLLSSFDENIRHKMFVIKLLLCCCCNYVMIKQIEISLLSLDFFCFCFCCCFNAVDNIIINQNYKKKSYIYTTYSLFILQYLKNPPLYLFFQVSSKNKPSIKNIFIICW